VSDRADPGTPGQLVGQAETPLGHRQKHHAPIRGQAPTIEASAPPRLESEPQLVLDRLLRECLKRQSLME